MSALLRTLPAVAAICLVFCSSAAWGSASPTLDAPTEVTAGHRLSVTATTTTVGQTCVLLTTSPTGRLRRRVIAGLHPAETGLRGTVPVDARPGLWTLQLRCGSRASQPAVLRVLAARSTAGTGVTLLPQPAVYRFSARTPASLRAPAGDQDAAKGAPPFTATTIDGAGASTSERAARALQWALRQVGRTDYALWCLRFVANAYNAPVAGYPTAQAAADALDLHGRGGSPASAPAGALVFFHVASAQGAQYGHVGISLGDGRMVSAQATVKIERVRDVAMWRTNYLGWTWPPAAWPGFPPPAPAANPQSPQAERPNPADAALATTPASTATPAPTTQRRIPIETDNRNTNGLIMVEDGSPLRLQTRPESNCVPRGCVVSLAVDPGRYTGGVWDAAICQIRGYQMTNGSYGDPADDQNPALYTSTLWYGIELRDGTAGFVPETWIKAQYRGGLGLPECPPVPAEVAVPATPSAVTVGYAKTPVSIAADNRYASGTTMIEDTTPVRLQTRPWTGCWGLHCIVPLVMDSGHFSGGAWTTAVCWTLGDRFSNADPDAGASTTNPGLFASRRWYGVALSNGKLGYANEAFLQAAYRGGLGLPYCPPYPDQLVDGW